MISLVYGASCFSVQTCCVVLTLQVNFCTYLYGHCAGSKKREGKGKRKAGKGGEVNLKPPKRVPISYEEQVSA